MRKTSQRVKVPARGPPRAVSQSKSFRSSSKHADIGPESFGIVVCQSMGTMPGILGFVWLRFRPTSGSKSMMSRRILGALLAQPSRELSPSTCQQVYPFLRVVPVRFGTGAYPQKAGETIILVCYRMLRNSASGLEMGLRAGFPPDSGRESFNIGPTAGFGPAGGQILKLPPLKSSRHPARKPGFRPGNKIA